MEIPEPSWPPISDGGRREEDRSNRQTTSLSPSVMAAIQRKNETLDRLSGRASSKSAHGESMSAGSNRSLGERVHDAIVEAAAAKNEAFKLERKYKRTLKAHIIVAEGKSFGERETKAAVHPSVTEAEDAWIAAELMANTAKAEADGLSVRFEEYRTREATARAEMNLR